MPPSPLARGADLCPSRTPEGGDNELTPALISGKSTPSTRGPQRCQSSLRTSRVVGNPASRLRCSVRWLEW